MTSLYLVIKPYDGRAMLEEEDKRYLREMNLALRAGVLVFEQLESDTIAKGSQQLLAAVKALPEVLRAYYARIVR